MVGLLCRSANLPPTALLRRVWPPQTHALHPLPRGTWHLPALLSIVDHNNKQFVAGAMTMAAAARGGARAAATPDSGGLTPVEAAAAAGHRGALDPWQSGSNGREESQIVHLNPKSGRWVPDETFLQRHVNERIVHRTSAGQASHVAPARANNFQLRVRHPPCCSQAQEVTRDGTRYDSSVGTGVVGNGHSHGGFRDLCSVCSRLSHL